MVGSGAVGSGAARLGALDSVVVGAGLLGWIASFLPWHTAYTSVNVSVLGINPGINGSENIDAWHAGVGAWCSVLLLTLAGVLVLVGTLGGLGASAARSLITLGVSVLAFVALVMGWVTFPDASGGLGRSDELGSLDLGSAFTASGGASSGAGVGLYLGLIAAIAAVVASSLTFRAAGRAVTG